MTVKARVLRVLREHPDARDDNNVLAARVWEAEDPNLPGDLHERLRRLSKMETIRRECKKIQHNEGRFPPSPAVLASRRTRIGPSKRST